MLVIVSDCDWLLPTVTLPKLKLAGFDPSVPAVTPVPVRGIVRVGLEALEVTVRGLKAAAEKGGDRSFGMFSCSKATNEMNFVAQKFARVVMGSNNIDSCNRT